MEDKAQIEGGWTVKPIQLRYSISDLCLFRVTLLGEVYRCPFDPFAAEVPGIKDLPLRLTEKVEFVAFTDLRIEQPLPRVRTLPGGFLYCLNQTQNYFIDLQGSFENYLRSLSSKTRSTLKRKVRRFTELSGGQIDFRIYISPTQMHQYYDLARRVARMTYQEKLFDGALPDTQEFCQEIQRLASDDRVRGFLLFLDEQPVAYLYVPLLEGVAQYAFLGYNPNFAEHSPGTVLLYMVMQYFFAERNVRYFDFGYGMNQTKVVFSTGQFLRADVYFFRKSFTNLLVLYGHTWMDWFSEFCGRVLDRFGLRRVIKRWLRSS